jgi:hypothetical protein
MSDASERRRKPRHRAGENTWVVLHDVPGATAEVRAKLLDSNDLGIGIETEFQLEQNILLTVDGHVGTQGSNGKVRARVMHCKPFEGVFRSGLRLEGTCENGHAAESGEPVADYYEILQISPNADPDMIHRVYRLLAQRYHPDNTESGDEKTFRAITEAYRVLSDAEKRAAYDVNLHSQRRLRWRIFDQRQAAVGKVAEKSKRKGILDLLYTKRCNEPEKPTMTLHEIEDLLGCPREQLEFSIWYLKENGLVARQDNGRLAVTAKGVDWAEQEEAVEKLRGDRLIEASHRTESHRN